MKKAEFGMQQSKTLSENIKKIQEPLKMTVQFYTCQMIKKYILIHNIQTNIVLWKSSKVCLWKCAQMWQLVIVKRSKKGFLESEGKL